jgi:hypothetical protein
VLGQGRASGRGSLTFISCTTHAQPAKPVPPCLGSWSNQHTGQRKQHPAPEVGGSAYNPLGGCQPQPTPDTLQLKCHFPALSIQILGVLAAKVGGRTSAFLSGLEAGDDDVLWLEAKGHSGGMGPVCPAWGHSELSLGIREVFPAQGEAAVSPWELAVTE